MRAGEFPDGAKVLRAKIDMASPNLHLRDPVIYRILHTPHPHAGDKWCIYPMYDYAHPIEDALEKITHSMCTLEFEVHRPLYDWVIQNCRLFPSQQMEFARLALTYTVMSKRKLLQLVQRKLVKGWDDPRMPTLWRPAPRGVPPAAIREFCERVGITKYDSLTDVALLEHCIRDDLNRTSRRAMAVLDPLRVVVENPQDLPAAVKGANNPEDPAAGEREIPFGAELFIEREDFAETPRAEIFSASAPARPCACATPVSSPASASKGRRRQGDHRARPFRPHGGRRQGQGHHPLGAGPSGQNVEVVSTTACSTCPSLTATRTWISRRT
jgi:glutaminyl-tRNA synthetase